MRELKKNNSALKTPQYRSELQSTLSMKATFHSGDDWCARFTKSKLVKRLFHIPVVSSIR